MFQGRTWEADLNFEAVTKHKGVHKSYHSFYSQIFTHHFKYKILLIELWP
jgi:hypothetical protein